MSTNSIVFLCKDLSIVLKEEVWSQNKQREALLLILQSPRLLFHLNGC